MAGARTGERSVVDRVRLAAVPYARREANLPPPTGKGRRARRRNGYGRPPARGTNSARRDVSSPEARLALLVVYR